MNGPHSLSTIYFDPEAIDVPEPQPEPTPEPVTETPKRKGRPPGSRNAPKPPPKKSIPWFNIWHAVFWALASVWSATALYFGMQSWLGQSAAYLSVAVATPLLAYMLDRDWKKMRSR